MEWIVILYIIFIIFSAILSAIREAQKKQANIPKKLEPIIEKELEIGRFEEDKIKEIQERTGAEISDIKRALQEARGNVAKAVSILKQKGLIVEREEFKILKTPKIQELPKSEEKKIISPYTIEEGKKILTFIETDLKERLPEAIVLMVILGPPRALQGFGPPYRRKVL